MPRFLVVTGTDTGVGKTFVTAGLARALVERGQRVSALKAVETGCGPATLPGEDGAALAAATGQSAPRQALIRLRAPLTPALAADREGIVLAVGPLAASLRGAAGAADIALVEGAGGLLSPLSWSEDLTHLCLALHADVLVVGADRLGTLNHALLTARILKDLRIATLGIVLSAPEIADASTGTNADALRRALAGKALAGRITVVPRLDPVEASRALDDVVAWLEAPRIAP